MTAAMTFQTRVVIDHIRGTSSALAAANPVVGYGVFVMETDADRGKFGDGLTAYNDLPYFAGEATWASLSGKPASFTPSSHASTHGSAGADPITVAISQVTGLQTALDGKQATGSYVLTTDSRLSDSREWSAATVTQAQAEAGTGTTRLAWTVQRVWQAIAAWWAASADKTKLDGVAVGATANSSDAHLLSRDNHTGTQVASTISDFSTAAVAAVTWTTLTGKPSFATVATTGSYTDLSNTPAAYTLPTATASVLGGVKIGSGISIDGNGVISASSGYTLPIASASVLGGIKIGSGLSIDGSGVVSAAGTYTLPNATTSTLGGVIIGTGLAVSSGTVSVTYGTSSSTACVGDDARLSDARTPTAHTQAWSTITSTPTTLAGYGITDGQKTITSGTAAPSGGSSGDIYLRYS
jgi:hypothetical protein